MGIIDVKEMIKELKKIRKKHGNLPICGITKDGFRMYPTISLNDNESIVVIEAKYK